MLTQTISLYLTTNKRLVVPQLGAFIVKEPGRSIVFSELLKRDDGVLRGLIQIQGRSELEAAGEIDRFVFEIRHAIQHGGEFRIKGIGVMKPGPNNTIAFEYTPTPEKQIVVQTRYPSGAGNPGKGQTHVLTAEASRQQAKATIASDGGLGPNVSRSAKRYPEPYVKGLRYGKPTKSTNAYTFVDGRRRFDRFLLLAIAAAIIAVGVIAYVFIRAPHDQEQIEQVTGQEQVEPVTTTAAPGTSSAPGTQTQTTQ